MRRRTRLHRMIPVALVAAVATAAHGSDWPQFRGPDRDGISSLTGLATSWPKDGPAVRWRAESGDGFSGMSVVDGRMYTMLGRDGGEYVVALDAKTGNELWSHRTDEIFKNQFGDGPRSTPSVEGSTVYAIGARGIVVALDSASGSLRWSLDLKKEFGGRIPTWGISSSPLVDGDRLLLEVGGREGYAVVALDKGTGSVVWHAGNDQPGYASPIIIEVGGKRQVVFMTGTKILGLNPDTGEELWEQSWRTSYDVNAAVPLFVAPNKLFISTGYDTGSALFSLESTPNGIEVQERWKTRGLKNQFQASVIHDGIIYGFDNTVLKALDLATGKERWKTKGWGHGAILYVDGHLLILSDQGKLGLVRATPDGYEEVAAAQVLTGKSWTVPTIANGTLYVRNEREILALDVTR